MKIHIVLAYHSEVPGVRVGSFKTIKAMRDWKRELRREFGKDVEFEQHKSELV